MKKVIKKLSFLNKFIFQADDGGSAVVEMCFIMPILIVIVFVVINMMLTQINKSITLGRMYQTTYNKESYIANIDANADAEETLENTLEDNLITELSFVKDIKVDTDSDNGHSGILNITPGYMQTEVSFEENNIGIFLILDSGYSTRQLQVNEEIRDTGNNLRRWQLYGKIL